MNNCSLVILLWTLIQEEENKIFVWSYHLVLRFNLTNKIRLATCTLHIILINLKAKYSEKGRKIWLVLWMPWFMDYEILIKKMIIKIFNSIINKRWKCLDFSWSTSHVNKTTETEIYIALHCNWWGWSITLI